MKQTLFNLMLLIFFCNGAYCQWDDGYIRVKLTITSSKGNNVCDNDIVTFKSDQNPFGCRFLVNNISVQQGESDTFSTDALNNGDVVNVQRFGHWTDLGYYNVSMPITMTVHKAEGPVLVSDQENDAFFENEMVTFTGMQGTFYEFFKNNYTIYEPDTYDTYKTNSLMNGDSVEVLSHHESGCVFKEVIHVAVLDPILPQEVRATQYDYCTNDTSLVTVYIPRPQNGITYNLIQASDNEVKQTITYNGSNDVFFPDVRGEGEYYIEGFYDQLPNRKVEMSNRITVIANDPPSIFPLDMTGDVCRSTDDFYLEMSQTERIGYALYLNNKWEKNAFVNDGSIQVKLPYVEGIFKIIARGEHGCSSWMDGELNVRFEPNKPVVALPDGNTYCEGESVRIGVETSIEGYTYQLINKSIGISLNFVSGTGENIFFTDLSMGTTEYIIKVVNDISGCTVDSDPFTITEVIPSNQYDVRSDVYKLCVNSNTDITLSGSDIGINYVLTHNGIPTGESILGTGGILTWSVSESLGGTYVYEIISHYNQTCELSMGSIDVVYDPLPKIYNVITEGNETIYLRGEVGIQLGVDESQADIAYRLYNEINQIIGYQTGDGDSFYFMNAQKAGIYHVDAINFVSGCISDMANTVEIIEDALITNTITFDEPTTAKVNDEITLAASASSGLDITYSVVSGDATLNGNVIIFNAVGEVKIKAIQEGNDEYAVAEEKTITVNVTKKDQTILSTDIVDKIYGNAPFNVGWATNSALPLTYTVEDTNVAIVEDGKIKIVGAGTTKVFGEQEGNDIYNAAPPVSSTLTVKKKPLHMSSGEIKKVYDGTPDVTLEDITLTGVIDGDEVTFIDATGKFESSDVGFGLAITTDIKLSGAHAGNYELLSDGLHGQILHRDLIIKNFEFVSKTYDGNNTATLKEGYSFDGLIDGDDLSFENMTFRYTDVNVGEGIDMRPASGQISGHGADNYSLQGAPPTGTITKATLQVGVVNVERKAKLANPEFELTYTGFVNGETKDVLTTIPTVTCAADENSTSADYPITVEGGSADNYDLNYVAGNLKVSPTYFTVKFVDGDKILKETLVDFRSAATAPENPIRTGYTFAGWDKTFENITDDLTVNAEYTINVYVVIFEDWNGMEFKTESVNFEESATAPITPTRKGYTFTGWDKPFNSITSELTVKAVYTINTFTVTFNNSDGTELKTEIVNFKEGATAPEDPKKTGFVFANWDVDFSSITADLVVTAKYTVISGVSDVKDIKVKLYPNPVVNKLTIEFSTEDSNQVVIYNMTGQKVYNKQHFSSIIDIDMSQFGEGIYLVKIKSEKGEYLRKVIKR